MNTQLALLSWFWTTLAPVGRPVEIRCRAEHLDNVALRGWSSFRDDGITIAEPLGVPIHHIEISDELLPWDLTRASARHRIVSRFTDRFLQAFGQPNQTAIFESGQLYSRDGYTGFAVGGAGIWPNTGSAVAHIRDDGSIVNDTLELVGHVDRGVILDTAGDTVAVVELAVGDGCPDDFLPGRLVDDPRAKVPGGDAGAPSAAPDPPIPLPAPTGRWSASTISDLVET